jgi:hypothetical protein
MASQGQIIPLLSTTTPLTGNDSWTSIPFLASAWVGLNVIINTDASGSLLVKWSGDNGSYWDYSESHTVTGGTPVSIALSVLSQTVQLIYTNGSVAQTTFHLHTFGSASNTVVQVSQQVPIEISVTGPNSVTVNSLPSPVVTETFHPFQTLTFNQRDSAVDVGPTTFEYPPETTFAKPIVTTLGSIGNTAGVFWGITSNVFYISSADVAGTLNDGPTIISKTITPEADTIIVEFAALFLDQSLPQSSTDLSHASIGYGIQSYGTTAIWSGITISSVEPYVWDNIYGRKALVTWNQGVASPILQKDWDDNSNIIEWQDLNAFRFIIQSSNILFQYRYQWANGGKAWRTMHTIQTPPLSLMPSKAGTMLMQNIKISAANNPAGVGCGYYNTYVSAIPPISSTQTITLSPTIATSETFIAYLFDDYSWASLANDVSAGDFEVTLTNLSTTGTLLLNIYYSYGITSGTGYTQPAGSALAYYTGGTLSGVPVLVRTFSFPPSSSKLVSLPGLRLNPGGNYYFAGLLSSGSSSTCWFSLNWNEYR